MKLLFTVLCLFLLNCTFSHAQWQGIYGKKYPTPLSVKVIDGIIYSGYNGGMMISKDEGYSWEDITSDLPSKSEILDIESIESNIFINIRNKGIYLSKNLGKNWINVNGNLPTSGVSQFVVNQNSLWVVLEKGGFYYSSNNGNLWNDAYLHLDLNINSSISLLNSNGKVISFTANYDFYYSLNNGIDWLKRLKAGSIYVLDSICLKIADTIFTSNDLGKTWSKINYNIRKQRSNYNWDIFDVKKFNNNIYISARDGYDTKVHYELKISDLKEPKDMNVWGIYFQVNNKVYCSEEDGTIQKEIEHDKNYPKDLWYPMNNYPVGTPNDFVVIDKKIIVSTGEIIYSTEDNGENWKQLLNVNVWNHANNDSIYSWKHIATNGKYLFLETDYPSRILKLDLTNLNLYKFGKSKFGKGVEKVNVNSNFYLKSPLFTLNNYVYYIDNIQNLYRSEVDNNTWSLISKDTIASTYIENEKLFYIAKSGKIYTSNDYGSTWLMVYDNNFGEIKGISSIAVKSDNIYIGTASGVFYSTNFGKDWNNRYIKTDKYIVNCGVDDIILKGNNIVIGQYCEYYGGIFSSNDIKSTFKKVTDGLPLELDAGHNYYSCSVRNSLYFTDMKAYILGDYRLYDDAPVWYTRLYYTDLNKIVTDIKDTDINKNQIDSKLNLSPNPTFESISMTISNSEFSYELNSSKSISIFNSMGIEVKHYNSQEIFGHSLITFSTKEFSSGLYYCTLSSGKETITKSFVVIK